MQSNINFILDKVTKPIYKARGFAEGKIINDWQKIVGERLAKYTTPVKIYFPFNSRQNGTLIIEVYNSALATELSYSEGIIVEKLSSFFGYKAVARLKLVHNPKKIEVSNNEEIYREKELSENKKKILTEMLNEIEDKELHNTLNSLGRKLL